MADLAAYIHSLQPGDLVTLGEDSATYVAQTRHPVWPHLQLVIWRMGDGRWSHDALDRRQYVGTMIASTEQQRRDRLVAAFIGGDRG